MHAFAHSVVRAAAWSDGGAEFLYADGTVLSFMDNMNTFVKVHSRSSTHSATAAHHHHDDDEDREMCFTAWTLSADEDKVRAALAVYNSLSERPRLLSTLLTPESGGVRLTRESSGSGAANYSGGGGVALPRCVPLSSASVGGLCGVWREPDPPLHTLLLEKRPDLFTRYAVYGAVDDWLLEPALPSSRTNEDTGPLSTCAPENTTFSVHELHSPMANDKDGKAGLSDVMPTTCESGEGTSRGQPQRLPSHIFVGTVLELWCALRRVRLTVAVHRETFTVRWPAPVTRPDGSRRPPTQLPFSSAPSCSVGAVPAAVSAASSVLFTYVEQMFPVCSPPPAWRAMLQMALEMDTELPATDRVHDVCDSANVESRQGATRPFSPEELHNEDIELSLGVKERRAGWLGELPEPHHWGGVLNNSRTTHPCRFSAITAAQAVHLAAPRTARALDAMRALHSSSTAFPTSQHGARLCWLYEASRGATDGSYVGEAATSPPAVYWCLSPPSHAWPTGEAAPANPLETPGNNEEYAAGADVMAWSAEDGSVAHVRLEGQGYTVLHLRVTPAVSAPAVYRLFAEDRAVAAQRLPPTLRPLRCLVHFHVSGQMSSRADGAPALLRGSLSATAASEQAATGVAVVHPLSLYCTRLTRDGVEVVVSASATSACATLALLTDLTPARGSVGALQSGTVIPAPYAPLAFGGSVRAAAVAWRRGQFYAGAAQEAAHLRCGRYLSAVVDVCVQLSQLNCAVARAWQEACVTRRGLSSAQEQHATLAAYCNPPPLQESCVNAPLHALHPSKPPHPLNSSKDSHSYAARAQSGGIVHLTRRLEGIGTFTALTNGTMRGHFDDRTIVSLLPGANELDEAQLLATAVLRDARRCTAHVAQCRSEHPLFRYLAYMLPFRRYVYLRATQPESNEEEEGGKVAEDSPIQHFSGDNGSCTSHVLQEGVVSPTVASLAETSISHRPSGQTSIDATTVFCDGDLDGRPLGASLSASSPCWGITDGARTLQALRERESTEAMEREERLRNLLAVNESLSQATRALLRE